MTTSRCSSVSFSRAASRAARRSVSSVATAGSADSGITGSAPTRAASRPARVVLRAAARTVFLVSLATIDSSHGRKAAPFRNRSSAQYAFTKACCTTSSASGPAPSAAAALSAMPVWARTSSAYASGCPARTRAITAASSTMRPPSRVLTLLLHPAERIGSHLFRTRSGPPRGT